MESTFIESGDGSGFAATVRDGGDLNTHVGNTVTTTVSGTVETEPAASTGPSRTEKSVSTSGSTLVGSNTSRRQIQIQNLDSTNPVHVRLAAAGASTNDLRVDAGQVYTFPAGVTYTGEIRAKAVGASVQTIVIEFD